MRNCQEKDCKHYCDADVDCSYIAELCFVPKENNGAGAKSGSCDCSTGDSVEAGTGHQDGVWFILQRLHGNGEWKNSSVLLGTFKEAGELQERWNEDGLHYRIVKLKVVG